MRYLIASDIHGDLEAATFIVNEFKNGNYDKLVLLGDILYHGPRNDLPKTYAPKQVIALLNPLAKQIIAIKGNCEAYVDQMVLQFKILEDQFIDFPKQTYYLCHGHKLKFTSSDLALPAVIIYGHYHIPSIKVIDDKTYVNVGSIALPKENSPKTYAVLTEDGLSIYTKNREKIYTL